MSNKYAVNPMQKMFDFNTMMLETHQCSSDVTSNVYNASSIIALINADKDLSVSPEVYELCDNVYACPLNYNATQAELVHIKRGLVDIIIAKKMSADDFDAFLNKYNTHLGKLYDGLIEHNK